MERLEQQKKSGHLSDKQKTLLIELMNNDEVLGRGKFEPQFTYKDAQRKWLDIATKLNTIPGANKTWNEWRRDIKKNTKKKCTEVNRYAQGSGGGPSTPIIFTEDDEMVLKVLDTTIVEGDPSIMESVVMNDNNHMYAGDHQFDTSREDYSSVKDVNMKPIDINPVSDPTLSTVVPIVGSSKNSNDLPPNANTTSKLSKPKTKNFVTRRLTESIKASNEFAALTREKLNIKKNYYNEKLLLRAQVEATEKIASALTTLASIKKKQDNV